MKSNYFNNFFFLFAVDMEGYDCTHQRPFFVSDNELVSIIARPRIDILTKTLCVIRLEAFSERYFNIYIQDINIRDCGVKLEFFDKDIYLKNAFVSMKSLYWICYV